MVSHIKRQKKKKNNNTVIKIVPMRKSKFNNDNYKLEKFDTYYRNSLMKLMPNMFISTRDHEMEYSEKDDTINIPNNGILRNIHNYNRCFDYVVIKLRTMYNIGEAHRSVIIIDNLNKSIEWFDTGAPSLTEKNKVLGKIKFYLPLYGITIINNGHYIQESDYDVYCIAWSYYFIYKRLYKKENGNEIISKLMQRSNENRVDVIRNFFYKFNN